MNNIEADIFQLAVQVGQQLHTQQRRLVLAESCTGGWISKAVTDVAGSSEWFIGGVVAYSNALKQSLLQVPATILATHGAISAATVAAMAHGALTQWDADIAVAVSGIAGPGGDSTDKPVGTVWFCWSWKTPQLQHRTMHQHFAGDRLQIRQRSVQTALQGILAL